MDKEKLLVTVNIADRNYKLRIEREEEETLRQAVKLIEDKSKEYSTVYAYKDRQDLLAMVSLEYMIELVKMRKDAKYINEGFSDKLMEIDNFFSEILSKK